MQTEPMSPHGDALAVAVRDLAHDAHRVLTGSGRGSAPAVLGRIMRLRRQLRGAPTEDLRRWLDSLQRRVEGIRDGALSA